MSSVISRDIKRHYPRFFTRLGICLLYRLHLFICIYTATHGVRPDCYIYEKVYPALEEVKSDRKLSNTYIYIYSIIFDILVIYVKSRAL